MCIKKCVLLGSLVLLLFGSFSFAQNRLVDFGLKGKVKSLQSITRPFENSIQTEVSGFFDSELYDSIYLEFDRKRNIVLRENYLDYRGKLGLFDRTIYQINPSNQLEKVETMLIQNGEEPKKISQKKIFYYIGNQLIRMDEFNSGKSSNQYWITNSKYSNGKLSEKIYWMEDQVFSVDKFTYDSSGILASEQNLHNNGQLGKRVDFHYENGLLTKKTTRLGNENTIESFHYDNVLIVKKEVRENSEQISRTEIFDTNGLLSTLHKFNHATKRIDKYSFKFELDRENNWVRCEISKNQIPLFIIKRIINYY